MSTSPRPEVESDDESQADHDEHLDLEPDDLPWFDGYEHPVFGWQSW